MEQARDFASKISQLSAGAFNLAADDVLKLRFWTETSEEYIFYHSIKNEIFCFHHLVNYRKLINT